MNLDRVSQEFADVRAFHEKFGLIHARTPQHLTRRKLKERLEFLLEELRELAQGCGMELDYDADDEFCFVDAPRHDQDLAQQADALVDLVYVALGTAVQLGLPWEKLWDDVQRANMAKVRGPTKRGHAVDVTKPEGWRGPRTMEILVDTGYQRIAWCAPWRAPGPIDEGRCVDDPPEQVKAGGENDRA